MLNFSYDKDFTSNYVDRQLQQSPFINMLNSAYKAVTFTKDIFINYPDYFGDNASSLFYIECCGRSVKIEYLYLVFETLLTNSNETITKAYLNNIPLYCVNQDPILQWCRYLQATHKFVLFEPVLSTCNNVLKTFIANDKHFTFNGVDTNLDRVKPLCVTNVGENIADLTMYIAYIFNFLIYCNPYKFNEVETGSNTQLFLEAINNYFAACYTKLITKGNYKGKRFNSLDDFFSDPHNIKYFDAAEVKTILADITDIVKICEIRNKILKRNDELLNICCSNQNAIDERGCYRKYIEIIQILFELIVKHNYYAVLYGKIEKYNLANFDYSELNQLTQYAVAGGNQRFVIDDDERYYCYDGNVKSLTKIPYIADQIITTKIYKSKIVGNKPFTSSNVYLEIIGGYIEQQLEDYQNNVLYHTPIIVDEEDLANFKDLDKIINALYINGKFALTNSSLTACLSYLMQRDDFREEYRSILYLSTLFKVFYHDNFTSQYIPAYILSFLPEYLAIFMNRQRKGKLNKFNYLMFFASNHTTINNNRIAKLRNIAMSVLMLNNVRYVGFVNKQVDIITKILTQNSYLLQPYVLATTSNLHVAAIGGVSLANSFINNNPYVRGYHFVISTIGNNEATYNFYRFVRNINDATFMKLFEKAIRDRSDTYTKELLSTAYENMLYDGKLPLLLSNFNINSNSGDFAKKTINYFNDLTVNGVTVFSKLYNFAFTATQAKDSQQEIFYCRQINIDKTVTKPYSNVILFGNKKIPCSITDRGTEFALPRYDYISELRNFNVNFINPNGYKLLTIYTSNSVMQRNNLFFIFTKLNLFEMEKINEKDDGRIDANRYVFSTDIDSAKTSERRFSNIPNTPNYAFKTNRMKLNGVDKQPIPNVASN